MPVSKMNDLSAVVLISANSEWRAVREILGSQELHSTVLGEYFDIDDLKGTLKSGFPISRIRFFHGGWGKISAGSRRPKRNPQEAGYPAGLFLPGTLIKKAYQQEAIISYLKFHSIRTAWVIANPVLADHLSTTDISTAHLESLFDSGKNNVQFIHDKT